MYNRTQIRRLVKRDAKRLLMRRPGQLFFVSAIALLGELLNAVIILGTNSGYLGFKLLLMLVSFTLIAPLRMGYANWMLNTVRHRQPDISTLFDWYNKRKFLTAIMVVGFFYLVLILVLLFVGLVSGFIITVGVLFGLFKWWEWTRLFNTFYIQYLMGYPTEWLTHAVTLRLGIILSVLFICILAIMLTYSVYMIRFKAAYNIIIDKPDLRTSDVLQDSVDVMEGRTLDMVLFYLSFIGWFLLIPITFGTALIFVVPYLIASRILYIEYFRDMYHKTHDYKNSPYNVSYLQNHAPGDSNEKNDYGEDDGQISFDSDL